MASDGIDSMEKIEIGLRRAEEDSKTRDFMPNAQKFVSWCKPKPEDFGLLSVEDAYEHASKQAGMHSSVRCWHDTVVYKTVSELGFMRVAGDKKKDVFTDFCRVYQTMTERFLGGEEFRLPAERRIEQKPKRVLSKEENIKMMEAMRAELGI